MILIETPYFYKGSSCLELYICSIENERNRYIMKSEFEQLFVCESFEEVINRYRELKNEVYA